MDFLEVMGAAAVFGGLFLLIYLLARFFLLIGQVEALEKTLRELAARLPRQPAGPAEASAIPSAAPSAAPAAPAAAVVAPPPLPAARVVSVASPAGRSSWDSLRALGLLPPPELKGEYALGAWWAVRLGGLLTLAAVGFLAVWLNLRSTIPPMVRVLEVVLVGGGLCWGGLRLSVRRKDLGEVVAATGLAVWQFAAWATYGLDRMRICESAAQAALIQCLVAVGVAVFALVRRSRLFGQLAVIFAAVAAYFSIGGGEAPWSTAVAAGLVAFLGAVLMVRGPWGSAGVLGLVGSQACLLLLYAAMPSAADYRPLQLAALGSFLVLWLGERLVKDDAVFLGRDDRSVFQLAAFFAPASLALFLATGGEGDRAAVALLIAGVAGLAGLAERRRNQLVSEVLLLAAVGFLGAGLAWLADPHLVWLIWALAAAATLLVGTRTRSELVRWASEVLAGVAAFAFVDHLPVKPWIGLAGVAVFGLLLAFREDWERPTVFPKFRRIVGILGVAIVALAVQGELPKADTGWSWLVLLLVLTIRFRPALLWAALPGYVVTGFMVVFGGAGPVSTEWKCAWAAVVLLLNLFALWRLRGREGSLDTVLRHLLVSATAVLAYAFVRHLAAFALGPWAEDRSPSAWRLASIWCLGGLLLVALSVAWRKLGGKAADLSSMAGGAVVGFVIAGFVADGDGVRRLGLAQAPFILTGLACVTVILAIHTQGQGAWGTVQRAFLGAVTLFGITFVMLANLPGAGVSLAWALASVLTFVLGHLLRTRSARMIGLVGLGLASLRVVSHDITDLLGRIAACGALALAFFGVAWLYGRITADQEVR